MKPYSPQEKSGQNLYDDFELEDCPVSVNTKSEEMEYSLDDENFEDYWLPDEKPLRF